MDDSILTLDALREIQDRINREMRRERAWRPFLNPCLIDSPSLTDEARLEIIEHHYRAQAAEWQPSEITASPRAAVDAERELRKQQAESPFGGWVRVRVYVDTRLGGRDWHFGKPHGPESEWR